MLTVCSPSGVWLRKCFHGLALLVFIPGLILDHQFLSFATALTTFVFVVAEVSGTLHEFVLGHVHCIVGACGAHVAMW